MSPQLSLFSVFLLPPVMGAALIFGRYVREVSKSLQQCVALSTEKANETLSAIRTVKAFCREKEEIDSFQRTTSSVLTNAYREATLRGSFFGLVSRGWIARDCEFVGFWLNVRCSSIFLSDFILCVSR